MNDPSRAEVLGFIAAHEPLEATLARFPALTREQLRGFLREAAVILAASEPPSAPTPEAAPPADAGAGERAPSPAPSAPPASPSPAGEPRRLLRVYSDGAARGNPGPAGAGAVLMKADGTIVARVGKYLGAQTNNHAEYVALLLGLTTALELGANEVEVFADSELLIRQLEGDYRVKSATLKPLYAQAVALLRRFRQVKLTHVPREQNALADEMSNRAIDERM